MRADDLEGPSPEAIRSCPGRRKKLLDLINSSLEEDGPLDIGIYVTKISNEMHAFYYNYAVYEQMHL